MQKGYVCGEGSGEFRWLIYKYFCISLSYQSLSTQDLSTEDNWECNHRPGLACGKDVCISAWG